MPTKWTGRGSDVSSSEDDTGCSDIRLYPLARIGGR